LCASGLLAMASVCHAVALMSIDLGSENLKVAVVAPGVSMDIALNKESKRKTPTAISFRGGERAFGDDAITAGMRSPGSLLTHFTDLLGKNLSHPAVQDYLKRFPHVQLAEGERGGVVVTLEKQPYSIEELVAQMLQHARGMAEDYTGQRVGGAVVTVPAYYTLAERRALLYSAHMAGLKVLSLISSPAAIGLNYGIYRRKEILDAKTSQHLLFYDMGAQATTASLVEFSAHTSKENGYTETMPQLRVLGVGYDRHLGGHQFQQKLVDHLAEAFNGLKKASKDVYEVPRAMNKIRKEAQKLKKVLSANTEFRSSIENVMEDIDLRLSVSRDAFEEMIRPTIEEWAWEPVSDALTAAGIEQGVVDALIIVGGATRIPLVQQVLEKNWGRELSKNINADEASALGAVYRSADIGQGYKVKPFKVVENCLFPIQVQFERNVESPEGQMVERSIKRNLYARGSSFPLKKVMTFNKHTSDFDFSVNYGDLSEHMTPSKIRTQFGFHSNMSRVRVSGVDAAYAAEVTEKEADFKGIKAHFSLDASGLLQLGDVEMLVEKYVEVAPEPIKPAAEEDSTLSKIGDTLNKMFGGEDPVEEKKNATDEKEDSTKDAEKTEETADKTPQAAKNETKKLQVNKILLNSSVVLLDMSGPTQEEFNASISKLQEIEVQEKERQRREASLNTLESAILDIKDKMSQDEYLECAESADAEKITTMCNEFEEWLYEDGFGASADDYDAKTAELKALFDPVAGRVTEHRERPAALKVLEGVMTNSSQFLRKVKEGTAADLLTDSDTQHLDLLITDTQKWLEEASTAQAALAPSAEPALTVQDIATKVQDLDREMKYLVGKMKIASERKAKEAAKKAEEEKKKAAEEKKKADKKAKEEAKKAKEEGAENTEKPAEEVEAPAEDVSPDPVQEPVEETHTEL